MITNRFNEPSPSLIKRGLGWAEKQFGTKGAEFILIFYNNEISK